MVYMFTLVSMLGRYSTPSNDCKPVPSGLHIRIKPGHDLTIVPMAILLAAYFPSSLKKVVLLLISKAELNWIF